jgi:hypothetical protein
MLVLEDPVEQDPDIHLSRTAVSPPRQTGFEIGTH